MPGERSVGIWGGDTLGSHRAPANLSVLNGTTHGR